MISRCFARDPKSVVSCAVLLSLLLLISPPPVHPALAQQERVILLANSVDYGLADELISLLSAKGLQAFHILASELESFKQEPVMVILGGHQAYEGVGEIVDGILRQGDKEYLEAKDQYAVFVAVNLWAPGQVVWVLAGYDRNATKTAHLEFGDLLGPTPFSSPSVEMVRPANGSVVGGLVELEAIDRANSILPAATFEFWNGTDWVQIDEDDGTVKDSDEERETRGALWDASDLDSGWYNVRVVMTGLLGQTGSDAIQVFVGELPVPVVQLLAYDPNTGEVTLDASDSYDPDGQIANTVWDWGDGKTWVGGMATHRYPPTLGEEFPDVLYLLGSPSVQVITLTLVDDTDLSTVKVFVFYNGNLRGSPSYEFSSEMKELKVKIGILLQAYRDLKGLAKQLSGDAEDIVSDAGSDVLDASSVLCYPLTGLAMREAPGEVLVDVEAVICRLKNILGNLSNALHKVPPGPLRDRLKEISGRLKKVRVQLEIIRAKLSLVGTIGKTAHGADIKVPEVDVGKSSYYSDGESKVHIGEVDVEDADVILHELGHYVYYEKTKVKLAGGGHWVYERLVERKRNEYVDDVLDKLLKGKISAEQSVKEIKEIPKKAEKEGKELAWSEGWANFFQAATQKDSEYWDKEPGGNDDLRVDYEGGRTWNEGTNKWKTETTRGEDVEGSVTGILWDLFDGAANTVDDKDKDGVSIAFKHIWCAINEKKKDKKVERKPPRNVREFHSNLVKCLDEAGVSYDRAKLDQVFRSHGVTP